MLDTPATGWEPLRRNATAVLLVKVDCRLPSSQPLSGSQSPRCRYTQGWVERSWPMRILGEASDLPKDGRSTSRVGGGTSKLRVGAPRTVGAGNGDDGEMSIDMNEGKCPEHETSSGVAMETKQI